MRVSRRVSRVFCLAVTSLLLGAIDVSAEETAVSQYHWQLAEASASLGEESAPVFKDAPAPKSAPLPVLEMDITLNVEVLDSYFTEKVKNAVGFTAGEVAPEDVDVTVTFPVVGVLAFETADPGKIDLDAITATVASNLQAPLNTVSTRIFPIDGRLAEEYAALGAEAKKKLKASLGQNAGVDGFVEAESVETVEGALKKFKPVRLDLTRVEYKVSVTEENPTKDDPVGADGNPDKTQIEVVFRRAMAIAHAAEDAIFVDRIADAVGLDAETETEPEVRVAIKAHVILPEGQNVQQAVRKAEGYGAARLLSAALAADGIEAVVDPVTAWIADEADKPGSDVNSVGHDDDYSYGKDKVTVEQVNATEAAEEQADVNAEINGLFTELEEENPEIKGPDFLETEIPEVEVSEGEVDRETQNGVVTEDGTPGEAHTEPAQPAPTPKNESENDRYDEGFADGVEAGADGKDPETARDLADGLNDTSRYAEGYAAGVATSESPSQNNDQAVYQQGYAEGYAHGGEDAAGSSDGDDGFHVETAEVPTPTSVPTTVARITSTGTGPGDDGAMDVLKLVGLDPEGAREPKSTPETESNLSIKAQRALRRVAYRAGQRAARDALALKFGIDSHEMIVVSRATAEEAADNAVTTPGGVDETPFAHLHLTAGERDAAAKDGYANGLQTANFALGTAFAEKEVRGAAEGKSAEATGASAATTGAIAALGSFDESGSLGAENGGARTKASDKKFRERRQSVFVGWAAAGAALTAAAFTMRARRTTTPEAEETEQLVEPKSERYGTNMV